MISALLWLALSGPTILLGVAILARPGYPGPLRRITSLSVTAALLSLVAAAATALAVALCGQISTPLLGLRGIGFSLYADRLTAVMLCLVAFIGTIVVNYSRTYMDGDPRQLCFTGRLCMTLAAVLLVILSGNLFMFGVAWLATAIGLNRLLLFYPERPAALIAARKKFIASRLGDLCLIAAAVLLYGTIGSLDYTSIAAQTDHWRAGGGAPMPALLASVFLVGTAMLKSAQFPTHGWLIEVMETPTPVSALLHAGIINSGGFLVLRFADLIGLSLPALDILALLGGFTALFGSVVMLTQTSIKVSLAYSTIAQMGFMMLECGFGAFSASLLHIVAHSLYKAHAFLSSGSVIDIARASWTPSPGGKPHPLRQVIAIGAVLGVTFLVSIISGQSIAEKPGVFAFGSVLLLSLAHLVASGIDERPNFYVVLQTLGRAALVAIAYFGLQIATEALMDGTLPPTQALRGPFGLAMVCLVVFSFAVVTFLQGLVKRRPSAPRWTALYAHVANGFYVNTLTNRLILNVWPAPHPSVPLVVPAMAGP